MTSKGLEKSAAKVKVKSSVRARKLYPLEGDTTTIGIQLSKSAAAELATKLLMLSQDDEVEGYITITGHKSDSRVTVLGRKRP